MYYVQGLNQISNINCKIVLKDLKPNSKFINQLIIIKGHIDCSKFSNTYLNNIDNSGRFIIIDNLNIQEYSNKIDSKWPINHFHEFKAIVQLIRGNNSLKLCYKYLNEIAEITINVNYEEDLKIEPLHLVIFLGIDSKRIFDMDPRSKLKEKNDLNSAIKRFQTMLNYGKHLTVKI